MDVGGGNDIIMKFYDHVRDTESELYFISASILGMSFLDIIHGQVDSVSDRMFIEMDLSE